MNPSSAVLFLVRGHPGSGKTTWAKEQQAHTPGLRHFENDAFFTNAEGHYQFDLARHQEAKDHCFEQTRQALQRGEPVVVSNTFTTLAELAPYLDLAKALGREARVIEMQGDFGNTHAVPDAVVSAKKASFEPYPGATQVTPAVEPVRRRRRPS